MTLCTLKAMLIELEALQLGKFWVARYRTKALEADIPNIS